MNGIASLITVPHYLLHPSSSPFIPLLPTDIPILFPPPFLLLLLRLYDRRSRGYDASKRFFKTDNSESWLDCYLGIDRGMERVDGLL